MDEGLNPETEGDQTEEPSERQLDFVATPDEPSQPNGSPLIDDDAATGPVETEFARTGASDAPIVVAAVDPDPATGSAASFDPSQTADTVAETATTSAKDTGVVNATSPGTDLSLIQPILVLNQSVVMAGPGSGVIRTFAFNFEPRGHGDTNDALRSAASFPTLASELGAIHGGDGTTTFGLPDLGGRLAVGSGNGSGLTPRTPGDAFGSDTINLELGDLPDSLGGNDDPIPLTSASTTVVYAVATAGVFPSRSAEPLDEDKRVDGASSVEGFLGEIRAFASLDAVPDNGWAIADGSFLSIVNNAALFSLLGTTYGGDGRVNFALPDLQGRVPVHPGTGPGLPTVRLGQPFGDETHTLTVAQTPPPTGSNAPFDIHQPSLGINHIIALTGFFPSRGNEDDGSISVTSDPALGEIKMFAGNFAPRGWAFLDGQTLLISQHPALFSLLGTTYGGDSRTIFNLPDLRGRAVVDEANGFNLGFRLGSTVEAVTTADVEDLTEPRSLIVTTTADEIDPWDRLTSLREAIVFANDPAAGNSGDADSDGNANDTITFAAGVGEAFNGGATITLGSALPALTSDITIDGDGNVTIDGNDSHRIFDVTDGNAVFEQLTLTDGSADDGGAIRAVSTGGGTITVDRSILTGNSATGTGGAISALDTGVVTVLESTISANMAGNGGGIYALLTDDLNVIRTTVADNMATTGGGGILSLTTGEATIANSSITGNTAGGVAGGFRTDNVFTIINTTIEGNTSGDVGGGVFAEENGSVLNSTITGNTATGGSNPGGGGLAVVSGTVTAANTIILGNSADTGGEEDINASTGTLTDAGGNLLGGATNPADVFASIDATTGGGQLADNGGPVQTVALLASLTNPAIDTGTAALPTEASLGIDVDGDGTIEATAISIDARGFARSVDVPGTGTTATDIGAFEVQIVDTPGPDIRIGTTNGDLIIGAQGGADLITTLDGNDGIVFGSEFDANARVDGGAGTLDQLGLQGDYSGGVTFGAESTVGIEMVVLLPGNLTTFGAPGGESYSYDLTLVDQNVEPGGLLAFQANQLRAGEDFTLDASAETDGAVFTYAGLGTEDLTGTQTDDAFFFGTGRFNPGDRVDGQGGSLDSIGLQGDYSGGLTFGPDAMTAIEVLALLSNGDTRFGGGATPFSYDLTMDDGNVAPGQALIVSANTLGPDETLTFDGSAETDGRFRIFSGNGADSIAGSQGADDISGRLGADVLTGNGGNDAFLYTNLEDSTAAATDRITDFTVGDRINLAAIDAVAGTGANDAFTFIGAAAFTEAGQLRAENTAPGTWRLEADVTGNALADLVIDVETTGPAALTAADFVL